MFCKQKGNIKEGTLEYQDAKKNIISQNMGKYKKLSFSWVSKLCLMVGAKIIALSDLVQKIFVKASKIWQESKVLSRYLKYVSWDRG